MLPLPLRGRYGATRSGSSALSQISSHGCFDEFALVRLALHLFGQDFAGQRDEVAADGFLAGGVDPEGVGVAALFTGAIGILDGKLRLADAAQPRDRLWLRQRGAPGAGCPSACDGGARRFSS